MRDGQREGDDTIVIRDEDIYDAICKYRARHHYSPSVRDICRMLGAKSTSTVHGKLERMIQKGMITMTRGQSRTIMTRPREEWDV